MGALLYDKLSPKGVSFELERRVAIGYNCDDASEEKRYAKTDANQARSA
ncbi:MAG TPA: hypothetical protein VJH69_02850 [Candidatus Paceibacterota bacterium]